MSEPSAIVFVMETNTATPATRHHITVVKWVTHRVVLECSDAEVNAYIARGESYGDELRDVDCAASCWCIGPDYGYH